VTKKLRQQRLYPYTDIHTKDTNLEANPNDTKIRSAYIQVNFNHARLVSLLYIYLWRRWIFISGWNLVVGTSSPYNK
jgi:hypothetical protein